MRPELGPTPVRTRCSGPVSDSPSMTCAQNGVSRRRPIPYVWQCLRASTRLLWAKGLRCLMLSLQQLSKTDRSPDLPPNKTSRPIPNTHQVWPGPGPRKRVGFHDFEKRNTPRTVKPNKFKIVWRSELRKWPLATNRTHFRKRFVLQLCESRR